MHETSSLMFARKRADRLRSLAAVLLFVGVFGAAAPSSAREIVPRFKIDYSLYVRQPETHLFDVVIEVRDIEGEKYIDFQMPSWSPGRYAVFDFAKNVQEVAAMDSCPPRVKCEAAALEVTRLDLQTWRVKTKSPEGVRLRYRVFADDLSGTFSQLDRRHANFNGASVFMYVVGHKPDPVTLKITPPAGWRVFNGYTVRPDQTEFEFANYDLLVDAPTEIAPDFHVDTFTHAGKSYRVLLHAFGRDGGRRGQLGRDLERIVRAHVEMMGEPEFERYTFIFHFDPTARRGDGMEHLNSTQIIETGEMADRETYESAIETASHEFFHVWNVKRLRPAELGPWDFTRPLATRSLWIAEGVTNYYGKLLLHRAGLWDERRLLESYAQTIGRVESAPGSRMMSAEDASLLAPFLDRAEHIQRTNLENTSISYYSKGETLAIALDLLIRGRSNGRSSLDEVMRRAYEEFYLRSPASTYYLRGRGYAADEFLRFASEVTGVDLSDFHRLHVRGVVPPPYEEAFASVGLRLVREGRGASRIVYRIERDERASADAIARREAWLSGRRR